LPEGQGGATFTGMPLPTTLAAVLFVELADFSDLLSTDERAALELLASYRQTVAPIVAEHHGETVDVTGSELLVVFSSAVAAVQCGLHLCKALLPFFALSVAGGNSPGRAGARVGVHLGEIWRDAGKVYGNGINVAARVMQAAPPGAFFVSEDVYRQVSGKLDLAAREVGDAVLKNIDRPLVLHEIDTGRGFLGMEAVAARHDAVVHEHPRPVLRAGPHEVPHVAPHAATAHRSIYASNFLPGPVVHELASRLEVELSETIRASVVREVSQALAGVPGMKVDLSHGDLNIVFDGKMIHAPVRTEYHGRRARVSSVIDDSEARREKAADRVAAATKGLVMSGGIAAGLGYGYVATGKWPLALGAAIVVLAPFLANLKRLVVASSELRLLEKRSRRKAGRG